MNVDECETRMKRQLERTCFDPFPRQACVIKMRQSYLRNDYVYVCMSLSFSNALGSYLRIQVSLCSRLFRPFGGFTAKTIAYVGQVYLFRISHPKPSNIKPRWGHPKPSNIKPRWGHPKPSNINRDWDKQKRVDYGNASNNSSQTKRTSKAIGQPNETDIQAIGPTHKNTKRTTHLPEALFLTVQTIKVHITTIVLAFRVSLVGALFNPRIRLVNILDNSNAIVKAPVRDGACNEHQSPFDT